MNQVPSIHQPPGNTPQPAPRTGAIKPRRGHVSPRLTGAVLIALSFLLMAALASWTIKDPSLSHATPDPVTNWLGKPGAIVSDLLMQILGLGSLLFTLPLAIWGWTFIRRKKLTNFGIRFACWAGATLFASGMLACLAKPESWPLPSNLGGLTGDLFISLARLVFGANPSGAAAVLFGLILAVPTVLLGGYALGLFGRDKFGREQVAMPATADSNSEPNHDVNVHYSEPNQYAAAPAQPAEGEWQEPQDDELEGLTSVARGAISHWVMTLKASLSRINILQRMPKTPSVPDSQPAYDYRKIEPTLQPEAHQPNSYAEPDFEIPNVDYYPEEAPYAPEYEQVRADTCITDIEPIPVAPVTAPVTASPRAEPVRVTPAAAKPRPAKRNIEEAQGSLLNFGDFELPPLRLLTSPPSNELAAELAPHVLEQNARQLEGVLEDFGISGDINDVRPGPVVTLYELEPAPGIRSSRVIGLADDIARSMSAKSARVSVVPGRNAIGIELPNSNRETVYLREMLGSRDFEKAKGKLPMCLGKNIGGEPIITDLARMPHLLIAGTTGSGKSVGINTMILSLLYRHTPEQCRLIMIDPKMLELSVYDGIPHLLTPVVTDPHKAVTALKWAVREMEERYKKMSKIGVRNIDGFNARIKTADEKGEVITRTVQTGFNAETGEAVFESESFELEQLPYIVIIVDEMADLMMVAGKDIEGAIQRLAQMARAAGIHMITATQRPSVDVITGTIKANFPTRISFQVTSKIDSRTILGEQGAEQLLGMGDMLYMAGGGRITRLHGPFVSDEEVEDIVNHLKTQGSPEYLESVTEEDSEDGPDGFNHTQSNTGDELYDKAVNIVLNDRKASTSYIQRRLSIGYNRAATLIEKMEEEGVISAANHAGKREILVGSDEEMI